MIDFILSVLASLFAAGIITIFASCFNKKLGSFAKRWLIHVFDMGTYDIFLNETDEEYQKDLERELKKAEYIQIFAGRGQFLTKEPYRSLLDKTTIPVNILLPTLTSNHDIDWFTTSLGYLSSIEPFRGQVASSIEQVSSLQKKKSNIVLKQYQALAVGRITITNDIAYFQPYIRDYSDKSPIYKYQKGSFMYKWTVRYFESYWNPTHTRPEEISNDSVQIEVVDSN